MAKFFFYGIPGSPSGFKIGVDRRGPVLDPDLQERKGSAALLEEIRSYMAIRFPAMAHARLHHHRICPYENSSDGNFCCRRSSGTTQRCVSGWWIRGMDSNMVLH